MGIYFNPGNISFTKDTNNEIYVDKTGLLEILNKKIGTSANCVALSHARRFGKSQAAGMIDAYYSLGSDSRELFSPFEIAQKPDFEKYLNKYNVIHIDVSSAADFHTDDLVETIVARLYKEIKKEVSKNIDFDQSVNYVLSDVLELTKTPFIIIIDEWDCVIRNQSDRPELVHKYLQFLHTLFKSEESKTYLALAYITGILPIKKIQDESALNNFTEYTMIESDDLTRFFGFTEDEVRNLCERYGMDFDTAREWYDGYLISGLHMYNPNSVFAALTRKRFDSYWRNTSAFSTINDYIELNYDGLKEDVLNMLEGGRAQVNVRKFQNDLTVINSKDDALTALIHLGYLAYDETTGEAYMPNYEVSEAFQSAIATGGWKQIADSISRCQELLVATIRRQEEKVADLVDLAHEAYTSVLKYNDENSLSCCLTMAYFTAPAYYNVVREFPAGKGFADLAFIPRADSVNKPAMIIELKHDKTADSAIRQIKEKRYAGALKGYEDEILLVGISYDKDSKAHECVIEAI